MNLEHFLLDESYVLGIHVRPYQIELAIDFALSPNHPSYRVPPAMEYQCYRRGILRVTGFRSLTWHATGTRPSTDKSGESDYGCIDQIVLSGRTTTLRGDWGEIQIESGELMIQLNLDEQIGAPYDVASREGLDPPQP